MPATIPARSSATTRTPCSDSGTLSVGDPQGQALGDRRLADAGLADQSRVVLAPAAEDLDHLLDLGVTADHGVDPPDARLGGQVATEVVESWGLRAPPCRLLALAYGPLSGIARLGAGRANLSVRARGCAAEQLAQQSTRNTLGEAGKATALGTHHVAGALIADGAVAAVAARRIAHLHRCRPLAAYVADADAVILVIRKFHRFGSQNLSQYEIDRIEKWLSSQVL